MIHSNTLQFHPQITFDEANIIAFNIQGTNGKVFLTYEEFLLRLDLLYQNTEDPDLCRSVRSIQEKIRQLTPREYTQLCEDTASGRLLFPPNYTLPHLEPELRET